MSRLVLERIVECGDSTSISRGIDNCTCWQDITDSDKVYELSRLIACGWEIVDVAVAMTSNCSSSGYRYKYDHTILTLVNKNEDIDGQGYR